MEPLQFNFSHPVTGRIRLVHQADLQATRIILLDGEGGLVVEVPLTGLCSGRWKAMLEWQYDGRDYYYEQAFEVPDRATSINEQDH